MRALAFTLSIFLATVIVVLNTGRNSLVRNPSSSGQSVVIVLNDSIQIRVSKQPSGSTLFEAEDLSANRVIARLNVSDEVKKFVQVHFNSSQNSEALRQLEGLGVNGFLIGDAMSIPSRNSKNVFVVQVDSRLFFFDGGSGTRFERIDLNIPPRNLFSFALAYHPNSLAVLSTTLRSEAGGVLKGETKLYKFGIDAQTQSSVGKPIMALHQGEQISSISFERTADEFAITLRKQRSGSVDLVVDQHTHQIVSQIGDTGLSTPPKDPAHTASVKEIPNQTSESAKQSPGSQKPAQTEEAYKKYLAAFDKKMKELVIGQPEAVDAMVDMEKQSIIQNNNSKAPSVVALLGLPGTGKDTTAEAYVKTRFALVHNDPDVDVDAHLFRMPVVKKEADVWTLTGSGTGYVGSEKISALNRFLVLHSGGKYKIVVPDPSSGEKGEKIELNPEWKPGQVLPGYFAPEDAVLFVNEFHDWAKDMKNQVLKEALEKGYFAVGNPGKGKLAVHRLQVPVRIVIASNDGIGLIAARDKDGKRIGAPLDYKQLMERWQNSYNNKESMIEEMSQPNASNPEGGTSPEVLSRIPKSRIVLLRPMSPEATEAVVKARLANLKEEFAGNKAMGFPKMNLEFSPEVVRFLATYDQLAEDGARTIKDKVEVLVAKTLRDGLFSGALKVKDGATMKVGLADNRDGTYSLNAGGKAVLIQYTEKGRANQAMTDEEIAQLLKLEKKLNEKVQGVGNITERLARDVLLSANSSKPEKPELATKPADVYMFLGVSSTGKTQLAKALHQVRFNTKTDPLTIDFGQIQSIDDLKARILGTRGAGNRAVPSDFMQHYDRSGGKLVVILDEISNANPDLLTALYDIMREAVVQTFSDGKPRPMGEVIFVMTGNAGEEWYRDIPRNVSETQQLEAARKIYDAAEANPAYRKKFLLTKFTEAFINRVGEDRIFFFAPHTAKTTRELIQAKLVNTMKDVSKPDRTKRTWDLRFQTEDDYKKTVQTVEDHGFKIWEQGASIVHFINGVLVAEIHKILLKNLIPSGSQVLIKKTENKFSNSGTKVQFELYVNGRAEPLKMELTGKVPTRELKRTASETLLTAYHEAGHEIVRHILMGDKIASGGVSILPGVTEIGGNWVQYEGIASSQQIESYSHTRETIVADIAILMAGEAAEQLTTKDARHTAGKSNDIQRATAVAQTAILRLGLSEKWGRTSLAEGQSAENFIAGLSAAKKRLFEKEVQGLLEEGRQLARNTIIANYDHIFMPVAAHLAGSGEVRGQVLERFYQQRRHLVVHPDDVRTVSDRVKAFEAKIKAEPPPVNKRDFEFYSFVQKPKIVVDVDALRLQRRAQELAAVDLSLGKSLVGKATVYTPVVRSESAKSVMKQLAERGAIRVRCETLHR